MATPKPNVVATIRARKGKNFVAKEEKQLYKLIQHISQDPIIENR
jgi:hypothetical protein